MQITMASAEELTMDILNARLVPSLISSPGIGKSALARAIADKHDMQLIDIRLSQMDPSDLNGFPFLQKAVDDHAPVKAGYVPMDIFPIEADSLPVGKNGWLVLLDEFNSAPLSVQAAAYKVILDRMVGMYKMHPKCHVISAGNLSTDKAIVNRVGTAMQSRLIWLEIQTCVKAWKKWADHNDIDHRVKSFINFKPDAIHKFDPNHNEHTFPCPRTWEFMSRIIANIPEIGINKLPLLAGTIGEGMGREFWAFTKVYKQIPTIAEIISNPDDVPLTRDPSLQHALAGLVAHHMTLEDANDLMKFVNRLEIDFQGIVLRAAIAKDTRILDTSEVKKWVKKHARELARY
jgi:hypothetical protein